MKVLLLTFYESPNLGGVREISSQVARQLTDSGDQVFIITNRAKEDDRFTQNGLSKIYRLKDIYLVRQVLLFFWVQYLVWRKKIDVIYLLSWPQGTLSAFIAAVIFKVRYVLHLHGPELIDIVETFTDKVIDKLLWSPAKRRIFDKADHVICGSGFCKQLVLDLIDAGEKITVVYCGVDLQEFQPDIDPGEVIKKHNLLKSNQVLLTVSNISSYKGHDIIIKMLPRLLERFPDIIYLIVGAGVKTVSLQLLVGRMHLADKVVFTGYVDRSLLPAYYNLCDIFIMLSEENLRQAEFEAFGAVFLEANSCQKPVIGSSTSGIKDAIVDGKTGYLVDNADEDQIFEKVTALLVNKELAAKLGKLGRQKIIDQGLDWKSAAAKIRDLLGNH